jgi:hypothetical protein
VLKVETVDAALEGVVYRQVNLPKYQIISIIL